MTTVTDTICGEKITIRVKRRLSTAGNLIGYTATVNGRRYRFAVLTEREAMDRAFVRYVKDTKPA